MKGFIVKRVMSAILTSAMVLTVFSGCSIKEVEQTNDKLTIWFEGDNANVYFREAIKEYEILYPDVELEIVNVDVDITSNWMEDFSKKLAAAVMAGEGPDIVQLGIMTARMGRLVSAAKMMNSGVFADLSEFYDNDATIDKNDLYSVVMDSGVFDGKRLFIPTQFRVPLLVSNKKQIEASGIQSSKCDTYNHFIDETTPILEKWHSEETDVKLFGRNKALSLYYYHNGLKYIDFTNRKINFNDEEFKKWMDYYKLVYGQIPNIRDGEQKNQFWAGFPDDPICATHVFEDLSMFPWGETFNSALKLQTEPIVLPLRNNDGTLPIKLNEMYAINATSKNKQNAWNFIKITMTPEFFAKSTISFLNIPISKKATVKGLEGIKTLPNDVYNIYVDSLEKLSAEEPFFDPAQYDVLTCMEPYFTGESDYDTCLKKLKETLEIYVSE